MQVRCVAGRQGCSRQDSLGGCQCTPGLGGQASLGRPRPNIPGKPGLGRSWPVPSRIACMLVHIVPCPHPPAPQPQQVIHAVLCPLPAVEAVNGQLRHKLNPLRVVVNRHLKSSDRAGHSTPWLVQHLTRTNCQRAFIPSLAHRWCRHVALSNVVAAYKAVPVAEATHQHQSVIPAIMNVPRTAHQSLSCCSQCDAVPVNCHSPARSAGSLS